MPGPLFSTLSPSEIGRAAWDDATGTLKTSLQAAIVGVQQEVSINAADDSVVAFQPNGASLHVFVDNFASLSISVTAGSTVTVANAGFTAFQGTNPWIVGGTVTVANSSLGVTFGGVTISNFPAVQGVTFGAAGTIMQAAILVSTTAVRLTVSGAAPSVSRTVLIAEPDPNSGSNFYVGSNTVGFSGPTRGIPVAAGDKFIANNDSGDYYIVSDGSTQTVFVIEKG